MISIKYFKKINKFTIQLKIINKFLIIFNSFGFFKLSLNELKNINNDNLKKFIYLIKNFIYSTNYYYFLEIYIIGLGYHILKKKNLLRFSLGHNHFIFLKIPKNIKILSKKNTFILLTNDKKSLKNFANIIKNLKPLNSYKEQGIYFKTDILKFKKGKQVKN